MGSKRNVGVELCLVDILSRFTYRGHSVTCLKQRKLGFLWFQVRGRLELPFEDLQSPTLPLCYLTGNCRIAKVLLYLAMPKVLSYLAMPKVLSYLAMPKVLSYLAMPKVLSYLIL